MRFVCLFLFLFLFFFPVLRITLLKKLRERLISLRKGYVCVMRDNFKKIILYTVNFKTVNLNVNE